jgi:transposase InsO family protein
LEQRVQFLSEWKKGEASMAALCRAFGISRPTGYKWVARYYEDDGEGDVRALEDRPRRPVFSPQAIDGERIDLVIRARKLRPHWGPRKLHAWLAREWPPFASTAAGGLTPLSVWWIQLGIVPERIEPGKPQQNGRHERMHRTLKQETASLPRASRRAQQRAFDLFRRRYHEERPHEALGQRPPAAFYEPSARPYRENPPRPQPPFDAEQAGVRAPRNPRRATSPPRPHPSV